ncbi:replication protein A 70 kDa DNA-binding subunit B [Tanacetum coccineum]
MVNGDKPSKDKGFGGASGSSKAHLDQFDHLFLHINDTSGIPLINFKLEGTKNYKVWCAAITIAIHTKNKIGFINEKIERPTHTDFLQEQCDRCNSVFIIDLYEVYAPIRSIILTIDHIPDVKGAFVTLSRDESHRMDVSKPNMTVGHPNGTKALVTHVGSFKMRMKPSDKITPLKDITPMVANMSIKGRIILMWHGHRQNEQHNPHSLEFVLQDDENGGRIPLLPHAWKLSFYNSTTVTRIEQIDDNLIGFINEPFTPWYVFNYEMYIKSRYLVADDSIGDIVAVNSADTPTVHNALFETKLFVNRQLPELISFRERNVYKMTGFTSWELIKKYGINPSAYFPDELNGITGIFFMFRVLYSEYNYTNNSHVYRCKKVFDDEEIVSYWKKGFGTLGEDTQDEYTTSANSTKYSKCESMVIVGFNLDGSRVGRERRKQAASFLITVGDEKNATRTQQHALFGNRKLARRKVKECSKIGREHTKKAEGRSKRHASEASLVEQEDIKARRLQHKYGGVESVSVALEVAFNEMEEDRVEIIKIMGVNVGFNLDGSRVGRVAVATTGHRNNPGDNPTTRVAVATTATAVRGAGGGTTSTPHYQCALQKSNAWGTDTIGSPGEEHLYRGYRLLY